MMVVNSLTDMARLAITIQLGNPSDTNSYQILLSAIPLAGNYTCLAFDHGKGPSEHS